MFAPDWDDLNDFLGDFSTTATITPSGKSPRQVVCIFDDPYKLAEIADYSDDTSYPSIVAKETDLADIVRADPVAVEMRDELGRRKTVQYYALRSPEGDGTGFAKLHLSLEG
jgi:hypothetical protein